VADFGWWKALLGAEWKMIAGAPADYAAAIVVGWIAGWLIIRAWYRRTIRIAESQTTLVATERDIERCQKEGLRQAILELKPDVPVLAVEISHGDPAIKEVVEAFGRGQQIVIPTQATSPSDVRSIAQVNYTTANNISQITDTGISTTTSAGSPTAEEILKYLKNHRDD
jgi:hypothetical protein